MQIIYTLETILTEKYCKEKETQTFRVLYRLKTLAELIMFKEF